MNSAVAVAKRWREPHALVAAAKASASPLLVVPKVDALEAD